VRGRGTIGGVVGVEGAADDGAAPNPPATPDPSGTAAAPEAGTRGDGGEAGCGAMKVAVGDAVRDAGNGCCGADPEDDGAAGGVGGTGGSAPGAAPVASWGTASI
jgi:hypothetical protein